VIGFAAFEIVHLALPLRQPHVAAHGIERLRETVLVRAMSDDGIEGWGECPALTSPTYTSEYAAGAFALLRDVLAPQVLDDEDVLERLDEHPMAVAGIRGACLDAELRHRGESLASMLGASRRVVVCTAVVSGTSIDDVLATVAARLGEGYVHVSIKVVGAEGLEVVRRVRDNWPAVSVAIDANGSLCDPSLAARIDELDLSYVEQPCPPGPWEAIAAFTNELRTPVALDEAIGNEADVEAAGRLGAAEILNLKPARLGGADLARPVLERARMAGFDVLCGGLLESGIGRAHALAFAALEGCTLPTQLGPSDRYYEEDVIREPFVLGAGATLTVPVGPGIGVSPDEQRLAGVTVERAMVTRR
jgi:O-succinylbenzoate synthase